MWWIATAVIVIPIGWFLITALIGFTMNPETAGKALLKKRLLARGLAPSRYSESVLIQITQEAVRVAEVRKSIGNAHFNNALVEHIEGRIELIGAYENGQLGQFDVDDPIAKALMQHRPVRQKFHSKIDSQV
jgi:hypothetical protein